MWSCRSSGGVFQTPPEETTASVAEALRVGYRLIDTAAAYGNEHEVGEGIRRSGVGREEVFIETKVWINDYGYEATLHAFDKPYSNSAHTVSWSCWQLGGCSVSVAKDGESPGGPVYGAVGMQALVTAKPFASPGRRHRAPVSLGSARFKVDAGKDKTLALELSGPSRTLLARRHKLKARFAISLTDEVGQRAVVHRTATLRLRRAGAR